VSLNDWVVDPMLIDIEQYDRVCILHCNGRFVAGPEMEYMQTKMEDIKRLACTRVLADFQGVTCIGSMGVAFIVGAYTSVMRKPGGRFVLAGVSPLVKHVLDLTRLSTVIPLASDLASGLTVLRAETPMGPLALSKNAPASL
jgi:anti-anti-sigma factor